MTNTPTNKLPKGKVPDWSKGLTLRAGDMFLGVYQPSPETTGYWQGVERSELLLKHCPDCGAWHHPKRIICSECRNVEPVWKQASGKGQVYSFSEVHRAADAFSASAPFVVGVVRLDEGVHMFTRFIASDNSMVRIGAPVNVDFRVLETNLLLPVFVIEEGER